MASVQELPTIMIHQTPTLTPMSLQTPTPYQQAAMQVVTHARPSRAESVASVGSLASVASRSSAIGRSSTIGRAMSMHSPNEELDDNELKALGYSKGEIKFLKNVIKCCGSENGFDLYQLMAFDGNFSTRNGCKDWLKYFVNIIKCTLCMLSQVFGIIIIMVDNVNNGLGTKELCNPPVIGDDYIQFVYDSNLRILAFLFSSFLAYYSIDTLTGVEQGMYKKMKHAVSIKWVNTCWLRVGLSVNVFVAIIAVYGSFVVIFFSDNSLDMVLNSVALFFIVELDDLLVQQRDYERIYDYILQYQHETVDEEQKKECCSCCKSCVGSCCNCLSCCFGWFYTLPFTIIRYVTIVACFIMPLWLGYCF